MTHDELLAVIEHHSGLDQSLSSSALRAVVELHKPAAVGWGTRKNSCAVCIFVDNGAEETEFVSWSYPCPTIQAIEKQL